ncbi:hypothetical protein GCM10010182_74180 [Actinomadura cremea]|nr:hypothetical protein GCM10010182_74180 [Actinomadura cremea]
MGGVARGQRPRHGGHPNNRALRSAPENTTPSAPRKASRAPGPAVREHVGPDTQRSRTNGYK